jgi:hypothetical protein
MDIYCTDAAGRSITEGMSVMSVLIRSSLLSFAVWNSVSNYQRHWSFPLSSRVSWVNCPTRIGRAWKLSVEIILSHLQGRASEEVIFYLSRTKALAADFVVCHRGSLSADCNHSFSWFLRCTFCHENNSIEQQQRHCCRLHGIVSACNLLQLLLLCAGINWSLVSMKTFMITSSVRSLHVCGNRSQHYYALYYFLFDGYGTRAVK